MSLITRNAKGYPSMTAQKMSQNLPKRDFLSLRHPNHFVLEGANNGNVIITYRFLTALVQANRDFFWHTGCMTLYISTVSTFLNIRPSY